MRTLQIYILKRVLFLIFLLILQFACTKKESSTSQKMTSPTKEITKIVSSDKLKKQDGLVYEFMKSVPFTGKSVVIQRIVFCTRKKIMLMEN